MHLFDDVLRQIRKGAAIEEATRALADVVRAVDDSGKPGSITVTLHVKPAKHGGSEKQLLAEIKTKTPRCDVAGAIFFSDQDGDLHRADPRQEGLKFGDGGEGGGTIKAMGGRG